MFFGCHGGWFGSFLGVISLFGCIFGGFVCGHGLIVAVFGGFMIK